MRLLTTICYIIFIVLGSIAAFNIFVYILGYFAVQIEKKGKIIFLLIILCSILFLFLSNIFLDIHYKNISNILLAISFAFFLIFIIIASINFFEWNMRNNSKTQIPTIKNKTYKNEPNFLFRFLSFVGMFYIFHEIFDDDDNNNDFHNQKEDFHEHENDDTYNFEDDDHHGNDC